MYSSHYYSLFPMQALLTSFFPASYIIRGVVKEEVGEEGLGTRLIQLLLRKNLCTKKKNPKL